MTTLTVDAYRRPLFDESDRLFLRCLKSASVLGAVLAVAMLVAPVRERVITKVEQLPTRYARLILEPPKPKPLPAGLHPTPAQSPLAIPGKPSGGGGGGGGGEIGRASCREGG